MIQENHSLSEHEIEHFKVFGFILRRKVFTPDEVQLINEDSSGLPMSQQLKGHFTLKR